MSNTEKQEAFSPAEIQELQEYYNELEELLAVRPKSAFNICPLDELNQVIEYYRNDEQGEKPPKADLFYIEYIPDTETGELIPALGDRKDSEWHDEVKKLQDGYIDIIRKVVEMAVEERGRLENPPEWDINKYIKAILSTTTESPEMLRAILPTRFIMPNNKLANKIAERDKEKALLPGITYDIVVKESPETTKQVKTECTITPSDSLTNPNITIYDKAVSDAVTSLYKEGDDSHVFTAAMIYRALTGATETETPSEQALKEINTSMAKLWDTKIEIDCTEELKKLYRYSPHDAAIKGTIKTKLLQYTMIEVSTGNCIKTAYKILEPPALYRYASYTKQVLTAPLRLLAIPDADNTKRRIEIKGYLLQRVAVIAGATNRQIEAGKVNNHIKLETIYKAIGETKPNKQKALRTREYIKTVLDYWVSEKYIYGYEFKRKGRAIVSIVIYAGKFKKS